jgi:hypothetical protein
MSSPVDIYTNEVILKILVYTDKFKICALLPSENPIMHTKNYYEKNVIMVVLYKHLNWKLHLNFRYEHAELNAVILLMYGLFHSILTSVLGTPCKFFTHNPYQIQCENINFT